MERRMKQKSTNSWKGAGGLQRKGHVIFQMPCVKRYRNSLEKRKRIRHLLILMYPVQLVAVGCWPEFLPETYLVPFAAVFSMSVLALWLRAESGSIMYAKVIVGEKHTSFQFPFEGNKVLEYVFANDYTSAAKKAVFHPLHVEVFICGKGRKGLIRQEEMQLPDEISLKEKGFQCGMDVTLRLIVPARGFRKAERTVPFFMGLSKEL